MAIPIANQPSCWVKFFSVLDALASRRHIFSEVDRSVLCSLRMMGYGASSRIGEYMIEWEFFVADFARLAQALCTSRL